MLRDSAATRLLALMLLAISCRSFAATPIAVEPFEQLLTSCTVNSDKSIARKVSAFQLTQRLSETKLAYLEKAFPDPRTRLALVALADAAAILPIPEQDIPTRPRPDGPTQREIVSSAVRYAEKTISDMPNFFATRVTTRFHDEPATLSEKNRLSGSLDESFRFGDRSSIQVLYRDGKEVVEGGPKKAGKAAGHSYYGLADWGVFGPLLGAVVSDALKGTITWSHWELGATGQLAVFDYSVPKEESHYDVKYCCVSLDRGMSSLSGMPGYFETAPGYHGELSIDPVNGSILRLTIQTELDETAPIVRDELVVEYGPVNIGGLTYICPVKSVTISRAENSEVGEVNGSIPKITLLNDVVYTDYHLFRAQVRVLDSNRAPLHR